MMEMKRIYDVDDELYQFCKKQKKYYHLENRIVTKEFLKEDMKIPEGFDEKNHYCQKIYANHQMIGYMDYQYGYRYSMKYDYSYVWIGLFLVDEQCQRQGYGRQIINNFIDQLDFHCAHIQLACIQYNEKGLAFWESLGFTKIGESYYGEIPVIVFQYDL